MIIRHLCRVGAGPSLVTAFAGRIVWPVAVDAELRLQAGYVSNLGEFIAANHAEVLGVPEEAEDEVEDIRVGMYTRREIRDNPTKHLGEAQCLYFAERDGHAVATNDEQARRRAWDQHDPNRPRELAGVRPVRVFHVVDVLHAMVRIGACEPDEAWDHYEQGWGDDVYALKGYDIPGSRPRFIQLAVEMAKLRKAP